MLGGNSISGNFRWVIYYLKKIIKGFLKLLKYISLLLAVLILQHVKIPDNFRFIEKYVDRINYGREFHPENEGLSNKVCKS
jgi:hypothetical protein